MKKNSMQQGPRGTDTKRKEDEGFRLVALSPVPFTLYPLPCAKRAASRQGFTLVEILVAIAILAVVLSTIYVSYISTMRIVRSLEYGDEIYYMARITLERMVLDLQSTCKEKDSYEFTTLKDSTGQLPFKGVSFLSRAHLDFSGPGDSMAVAQISYELEGDAESGGFSIVRRDVLRQGTGSSGGEGYLLCRRLQFVNLRFFDANGTRVSPVGQPDGLGGPEEQDPGSDPHRAQLHQPGRRGQTIQVHDPNAADGFRENVIR